MSKTSKSSSVLSGMMKIFQQKPTRITSQKARRTSARLQKKKTSNLSADRHYSFKSAEIAFQENACDAVKQMEGKRFLVRDVPPIPVPDCTSPNCECSYIRHNDRRGLSVDRRTFFNAYNSQYLDNGKEERREKAGRRESDSQ